MHFHYGEKLFHSIFLFGAFFLDTPESRVQTPGSCYRSLMSWRRSAARIIPYPLPARNLSEENLRWHTCQAQQWCVWIRSAPFGDSGCGYKRQRRRIAALAERLSTACHLPCRRACGCVHDRWQLIAHRRVHAEHHPRDLLRGAIGRVIAPTMRRRPGWARIF